MQNLPTVAICIPTFNQANYLAIAVNSACSQTYPNIEVWVSDDASTDETADVMDQLVQKFPQLHYYRQPQNLGIAANNNWLLRQPKTAEFIVRLDSDDVLSPTYVETLLALMTQYPQAGYAHSAVQEINENRAETSVRRVARKSEFQTADIALKASVSGYRVAANICMFRSAALCKLNFYENRPNYTEDYDLSVRMANAGYGNVYSEKILSYYRVWTDAQNTRPRRKELELKGLIRVFNESLTPSFQARGWSLEPVIHNRRRLALIHAASCYAPWFTDEEKSNLTTLLKELGNSPALQLRLIALRLGFAPLFQWWQKTDLRLRGIIKGWLSNSIEVIKGQKDSQVRAH